MFKVYGGQIHAVEAFMTNGPARRVASGSDVVQAFRPAGLSNT